MKNNVNIPIEPYIKLDGGYAICPICKEEIRPGNSLERCLKCDQLIDWSWMDKNRGKI